MRGVNGLRRSHNRPILLNMENIPTPTQHRVLPWAANFCTLAVMVAATVWSSAQRPTAGDPQLSSAAATALGQKQKQIPRQSAATPAPAPVAAQTAWPAQTSTVQADTIKTVGYAATLMR